jgi:ribosomal protein S18 acetylase RimI-like enzyme
MSDLVVRQLAAPDAAAFRAIRLEGLQTSPEAFGSTYEAESGRSVAEFARTLERSYVAGAFAGEALVGVAGFYVLDGPKVRHRGNIWGVYVQGSQRGRGVGKALIINLLDHARTLVQQVHLTVVTENAGAKALYERLGFAVYGTEPRSLRVGERYYDEHLMVRRLDKTQ